MAQTKKEILRDTILTQMQPYLNNETMDILNQVLIKALYPVDVIELETLLATYETTNEYILKLYEIKKMPKLSKQTSKYYLISASSSQNNGDKYGKERMPKRIGSVLSRS